MFYLYIFLYSTKALSVSNGSLVAENGIVSTTDLQVNGSVVVNDSVDVVNSLNIGSHFSMSPEGMTVEIDKTSGSFLEFRSNNILHNGTMLEIHTAGYGRYYIH